MYKKSTLVGVCTILAGVLLLSACSGQTTPQAPTLDANAIYTQAAATVSAGLALTEQTKPTETVTPIPPATLTPTSINPTVAQPGPQDTPAGTGTAAAVTATLSGAVTPLPSSTLAVVITPSTTGDKMEWIANTPADKTKIKKSEFVDVYFTIKNTGTTTWTGDYTIRLFAGDTLGCRPVINFPVTPVKPGETVKLSLGLLQAPPTAKASFTWWKITNTEGKNFGDVTLELEITD